mmetsp:Transcript_50172/g.125949  ORF Transcript_50172/g.125949 Transcript_50172/m.125949 type:complete len:86 (+) Transcript_50172:152-409(+)
MHTTVVPHSLFSLCRVRMMCSALNLSRADWNSSNNNTRGRLHNARAMFTICICPPEKFAIDFNGVEYCRGRDMMNSWMPTALAAH